MKRMEISYTEILGSTRHTRASNFMIYIIPHRKNWSVVNLAIKQFLQNNLCTIVLNVKHIIVSIMLGMYGCTALMSAFYADSLESKGDSNSFLFWILSIAIMTSSVISLALYARKPQYALFLFALLIPFIGIILMPVLLVGLVILNIVNYNKF